MLVFIEQLRARKAGLRVVALGGEDVDMHPLRGSMAFTVMAALGQVKPQIKRECITDSGVARRAAGKDPGGRRSAFPDSQIRAAVQVREAGEPSTQVARDPVRSWVTLHRRIRKLP